MANQIQKGMPLQFGGNKISRNISKTLHNNNNILTASPVFKLFLGLSLCTLGGAVLFVCFRDNDEENRQTTNEKIKRNRRAMERRNPPPPHPEITQHLVISKEHIPLIVGRTGSNLSLIEEKTATTIQFKDKDENHKLCEIRGFSNGVAEAKLLLLKEIDRSPIVKDEIAAESLENQSSCTEMKTSKCSFTWTIKNFKYFQDEKEIISPAFHVAGKTRSKWRLKLVLKNEDEKNKDVCSLFLCLESCLGSEIKARFTISVLSSRKAHKATKGINQKKPVTFKPGHSSGWNDFIDRDSLFDVAKGFRDGENWSIICEVTVLDEVVATVNTPICVTVPKCQVLEDLESLLGNENFSDVTLTAGDCEYRAHKNILATRSKVFQAMFTHDMEESRSSTVNIPDISGDVCKEMLHFIYTGKAPNIDEVAKGLLAAAEKYELLRLKAMCEEALARRLCVENATATLILADLHGAGQLKAKTVKFIASRASDVLQTEDWKNMSPSHAHLIMETSLAIWETCQPGSKK